MVLANGALYGLVRLGNKCNVLGMDYLHVFLSDVHLLAYHMAVDVRDIGSQASRNATPDLPASRYAF